jgi:error-prone DNA polymerase
MAFAGFSAGEAEGLRRAMSRKRSAAAIEAHHRRFVEGAMERWPDVGEALAERVFTMISGFSGFGFPKAHGAAFGLLAYQSTWLRVHYGPEFLAALLDEQPMGFYPPDALVHDAQRRGIPVQSPDVNASAVGCTVTPEGAVRVGLGYVLGVKGEEVAALVAEREAGGPFGSLDDLASRAGAGRPALEQLAWSGACDSVAGASPPLGASSRQVHRNPYVRREVLWRLGVATPPAAARGGTQLALPLDLPAAPELRELGDWDAMLADYRTTGLTTATHPMALLRSGLAERGAVAGDALPGIAHGAPVRVGGLVVARQRPGTASGICFMLLEDEHGTINLVVPGRVYEQYRLTVRTEPLVVAEGRLERHPAAGGGINVLVRRITALQAPARILAEVKDFSPLDARELERHERAAAAADPAGFRAVAPPVMSFAQGRRR